jgi:uncharacterized membrane protein YccC
VNASASRARGLARDLLAEATRLNFDQVDLGGALRCTIGVLIPLVVGLSTGAVAVGLAAAIGALMAGMASFQGTNRKRAGITLLVAAGMSVATITGALADRADWSAIVVVAAWGLLAGMMTALSPAYLVVGVQWCVAVIIVNAIPMTTTQALVRGAAVLAGGVLQTILVVLAFPIRSYRTERRVISAVYRELAAHTESITGGSQLGIAPTVLNEARAALRDPQPLGRLGQLLAFQALVDEAERMRIELVALARQRQAIEDAGGDTGAVDRYLFDAATILRSVATAVLADSMPTNAQTTSERLADDTSAVADAATAEAASAEAASALSRWMSRDLARICEAFAGQLRSTLRTVEESAGDPQAGSFDSQVLRQGRSRRSYRGLAETLVVLRANISWQSSVFRHAVRLAGTLAVAMIIYRLSGIAHGYWIALTALIVLRPDFTSTASRGVSRVGGTILGAGLATVLVAGLRPDTTGLAVMFGIASFLAFVMLRVNYGLFSVCVTGYVVFLLAFAALPAMSSAGERVESTLIGGALAIGVYMLWPTWESRLVGPQLADLLDAQAGYAGGVLSCFTEPGSDERPRLGDLRSGARLARSNAELSVGRMAAEPERSRRDAPISVDQAQGVIAAARRASLAVLTLHAHVPPVEAVALPAVGDFAGPLVERMRHNAVDLRQMVPRSTAAVGTQTVLAFVGRAAGEARSPHQHDDYLLRGAHSQLMERLQETPGADEVTVALVGNETDELVDAVNSVSRLI